MVLERSAAAVAVALAAVLAVSSPAHADRFQIGFPSSIHIEDSDDGRLKLRITENGRTIKAEARGSYTLNDDETDFESVSPGSYFRIEERRHGRNSHRYEVRGLPDGGMQRTYERGDARELDAEGRAWLADVLLVIVRNTSFALEGHIEKVLARDGLDAALADIATTEGDHAQHKAYRLVLDRVGSEPGSAQRIAEAAAGSIGSDHELSELLREIMDQDTSDAVLAACAEASLKIGSDHERGQVLRAILDRRTLAPATLDAVVRSAAEIGSDHERAEVLIAMGESQALASPVADTYFDAVAGIGSDHEKGRTLTSVFSRAPNDPTIAAGTVRVSRRIGSDHERAKVLSEVAAQGAVDAALAPDFFEATGGIGSDHEHANVLIALLQLRSLEPEILRPLFEDAERIGSDARKADVLEEAVRSQQLDGDVRPDFLRAVDTIGSDAARRRVQRAFDESRM